MPHLLGVATLRPDLGDGDPPERIGRVRDAWLRAIASDNERQALSARELLDRFKAEKVFWRQFEIGQALAAANDPLIGVAHQIAGS